MLNIRQKDFEDRGERCLRQTTGALAIGIMISRRASPSSVAPERVADGLRKRIVKLVRELDRFPHVRRGQAFGEFP